jgi:hypothetical protein
VAAGSADDPPPQPVSAVAEAMDRATATRARNLILESTLILPFYICK